MKRLTRSKIQILILLLSAFAALNAFALPYENDEITINSKYGSECYDPGATSPTGENLMTIMKTMNCNSIDDTQKFCDCVKLIAADEGITDPREEFKQHYIKMRLFRHKGNKQKTFEIKFRNQLLTQFIKAEELEGASGSSNKSTCGIFEQMEEANSDALKDPVAKLMHYGMTREFNFSMRGGQGRPQNMTVGQKVVNKDERVLTDEEIARKNQQDETFKENVSTLRNTASATSHDNRKAVKEIIKYMLNTESKTPGKSIAEDFVKNRGMGLNAFRETEEYQKEAFEEIRLELLGNPIVDRSSLSGVSNHVTSDMESIFSEAVRRSLKYLNQSNQFANKFDQISDEDIDIMLEENLDNYFQTAIAESCTKLTSDYREFLSIFDKNINNYSDEMTYRKAEREYEEIYGKTGFDLYQKNPEALEEKRKETLLQYRKFEGLLASEVGQYLAEDTARMMVVNDLHFCQTPPTAPESELTAFFIKTNLENYSRTKTEGGERKAGGAEAVSNQLTEEEVQEIVTAVNMDSQLSKEYDANLSRYRLASEKRNLLEEDVDRSRRALRTLEQTSPVDYLLINQAKSDLAKKEAELEQAKAFEREQKELMDTSYNKWVNNDTEAFRKHGFGYRELVNVVNGSKVNEICNSHFEEDGDVIYFNNDWAEKIRECHAKLSQQIKDKYQIDLNSSDTSVGGVALQSVYSGDAQSIRDQQRFKVQKRNKESRTILRMSLDEMAETFNSERKGVLPTKKDVTVDVEVKAENNIQNSDLDSRGKAKKLLESDPFAEEALKNQENTKITKLEGDSNQSLEKKDFETTQRSQRRQSNDNDRQQQTEQDQKIYEEKFSQIQNTVTQFSDGLAIDGQKATPEQQAEMDRIAREANEIYEQEQALEKADQALAELKEQAGPASAQNQFAQDPQYQKLLEEIRGLRKQNENLQEQALKAQQQRIQQQKRNAVAKAKGEVADPATAKETRSEEYIAENALNSGRFPASNNSGTQNIARGDQVQRQLNAAQQSQQASAAPSRQNIGGGSFAANNENPLPTPINRGGELQNATVTLNSGIANGTKALPILSGVDQSREVLTGSVGFNNYISLVGSNNELSLESFNEIRLNPEKFKQLNIDGTQPLIIKTASGHMVMLAVLDGDRITGFRYVKEVSRSQVARRITSEREEILERKERLVKEADLDALLSDKLNK